MHAHAQRHTQRHHKTHALPIPHVFFHLHGCIRTHYVRATHTHPHRHTTSKTSLLPTTQLYLAPFAPLSVWKCRWSHQYDASKSGEPWDGGLNGDGHPLLSSFRYVVQVRIAARAQTMGQWTEPSSHCTFTCTSTAHMVGRPRHDGRWQRAGPRSVG